MTPQDYVQQKAAASGSSFYYAFLFLPAERRAAITAFYAFCREVDDVVDEVSDPAVAQTKLAWWRREVAQSFAGSPTHPVMRALMPVSATYAIEARHLNAVIDGCQMDLEQNRYLDFANLQRYCHLVAGVVGEVAARIFGQTQLQTTEYAHRLGLAFQLTNIVRDVGEDAARGRIYLPVNELQSFNVKAHELLQRGAAPGTDVADFKRRFTGLMQFQCTRALQTYDDALALLPAADRRAQKPGLMMASIYRTLLQEIAADPLLVLTQRVSLTPLRKFWLAWRVQALVGCDPHAPPLRGSLPPRGAGLAWGGPALRPSSTHPMKRIAIVGAGWAGMAAAVEAAGLGMDVTVFEATRTLGGRARALTTEKHDGTPITLDNGQHILIGAYSETLALMQRVGLELPQVLMALPLSLPYPDGTGLQTPAWAARWPAPLDALAAIATARGWSWGERLALIRASLGWQLTGFRCAPTLTVEELCESLPDRVVQELIEPLCVSALNLPSPHASAATFLNVMRDALFGRGAAGFSASSLLLPRTDLSSLLPDAAARWLQAQHGATTRIRPGARITGLLAHGGRWQLTGDGVDEAFDRVIWATPASVAAQTLLAHADDNESLASWALSAHALEFTAITTVYAHAAGARLPAPMLALRAEPDAHAAPAQFVFDRGQLSPADAAAQGVLAFVVSASSGERDDLQARVLQQGARQLGLALQPLLSVVEKRATFACTPGLERPGALMAPGLFAAGDYVQGPYPATLEGAVRSGVAAARLANS